MLLYPHSMLRVPVKHKDRWRVRDSGRSVWWFIAIKVSGHAFKSVLSRPHLHKYLILDGSSAGEARIVRSAILFAAVDARSTSPSEVCSQKRVRAV